MDILTFYLCCLLILLLLVLVLMGEYEYFFHMHTFYRTSVCVCMDFSKVPCLCVVDGDDDDDDDDTFDDNSLYKCIQTFNFAVSLLIFDDRALNCSRFDIPHISVNASSTMLKTVDVEQKDKSQVISSFRNDIRRRHGFFLFPF